MSQVPDDLDYAALNRDLELGNEYPRDAADMRRVMELRREGATTFDPLAEKQVAGIACLSHKMLGKVRDKLQPFHFVDEAMRNVYLTGLEMLAEGLPEDPIVFLDRLKRHGGNEQLGMGFVAKLANDVQSVAHLDHYADIVIAKAQRRRLQQLGQDVLGSLADGAEPAAVDTMLANYLEYRENLPSSFNPFDTLSCDQLELTPDEEYLVSGCIVRNQANMIGGPPKAFKTTIAVDMALSMATAGYFLGYFKCPRAIPVLFMSAESGLSTLRKTAKSIAKAAGVDWPNIPNLRFSTMLPKFGIDAEIKRLDATFKANPFECLFIDPLYKCFGSTDSGNMFAAGELLMHFGRWCEANSVTLVLLHHLKKSVANPYEPADLQDFSWAGFAEHARSWILLSRREKYAPPSPHKLWLATGGSAGHGGLWGLDIDQGEFVPGELRDWNISLQPAAELQRETAEKKAAAKNEAKLTSAQAKAQANINTLLSTLKEFPQGETKNVIRTRSGLNTAAIDSAIYDALQAKQIESCDVFKSQKRTPLVGYRLASTEAHGPHGQKAHGLSPTACQSLSRTEGPMYIGPVSDCCDPAAEADHTDNDEAAA